jgi:hypothetical protein
LKGRGVLKAQLADALASAQVPRDVAEQTAALLARCDELRFTGAAVDLASFATEVRDTCQKLTKRSTTPGTGVAP